MICQVVNMRGQGRRPPADPLAVWIDRRTILGNPYDVATFGRAGAIARYREHFAGKLRTDRGFAVAVEHCRGRRLRCWCKPAACHGDVIAKHLETAEPLWLAPHELRADRRYVLVHVDAGETPGLHVGDQVICTGLSCRSHPLRRGVYGRVDSMGLAMAETRETFTIYPHPDCVMRLVLADGELAG